jgi:hypothetical protein
MLASKKDCVPYMLTAVTSSLSTHNPMYYEQQPFNQ